MLNIFKKKQSNFDNKSFNTNFINTNLINKEEIYKIQSNGTKDEYKNIIYYPSSSKE